MEVEQSGHRRELPAPRRLPRRGTDRVGDAVAWLLVSLALLVAVLAILAGRAAHDRTLDRGAGRFPVQAVLLSDAAVAPAVDGLSLPRAVEVPARWTGRDGAEHRGAVPVVGQLEAGSTVLTWVGVDDRPAPPSSASAAGAVAVLAGLGTALAGWAMLGAVWWGVRRWIGLRNAELWARGWERVEPHWTGRAC